MIFYIRYLFHHKSHLNHTKYIETNHLDTIWNSNSMGLISNVYTLYLEGEREGRITVNCYIYNNNGTHRLIDN